MGEAYDNDLTRGRRYVVNTRLLMKRRDLWDALAEAEAGIDFLTGIGQGYFALMIWGMKPYVQILLDDLDGAADSLVRAAQLVSREKRVLPCKVSGLLIAQQVFDVRLLEEALRSGDTSAVPRLRKAAFRSREAALKNSMKFAADRPEALRQAGVCEWILGKRKNALEYWAEGIQLARKLEAKPELGRLCFEVGRRVEEDDDGARAVLGKGPRGLLEDARGLFEELELDWDLARLEELRR
jgi:hypothetical protein